MKTVNMQGQPCPIPVVKAKEALAERNAKGVIVLVDNITAVQNLEKMAKGTGYGFSSVEEGALYRVTILKGAAAGQGVAVPETVPEAPKTAEGERRGPVVLITADSMGRGSEELGRLLIKGFIFSLTELNPSPEAVVFLNAGAQLTTEGANTVEDLKKLEGKGALIHTCGTCANYYKLTEALAVGSIVDMMHIVKLLAKAASVITV